MSEAIRNRVNEFWEARKQHKSTSTTFQPFSLHSLLVQDYKPVQHVTVLNTEDKCNTIVSICIPKNGKHTANILYKR